MNKNFETQLRLGVLISVAVAGVNCCGGSEKHADRPAQELAPIDDPSAQITMFSSSRPNRNASGQDLGRGVAETLFTRVNDCDAELCAGETTPQLVDGVRARAAEARSCYEETLKATPTLAGRVVLSLRISHDGQACPMRIAQNELAASTTLVPCLRALLERSFPKPKGGCVDIRLPLKFVPEYVEADAGR